MYKVGKSRLKYWRTKRGLTQQELADRVGRARSKVSDHENNYGDTMSFEAAFNYSVVLGCKMEELAEWVWAGDGPEPRRTRISWQEEE